jgi:hypothetical protein
VQRGSGVEEITGADKPVWFSFIRGKLDLIPVTVDIFDGNVESFTVDNSVGFLVGKTGVCCSPLRSISDVRREVCSWTWCELGSLVLGEKGNVK